MPGFDIREAAPEETRAIRRAGSKLVTQEFDLWIALAKLVASAAAGKRIR